MNLVSSTRIAFDELRVVAFGDIDATYSLIGNLFSNPVRILKIYNTTDVSITVSYNGITDHDFFPGGGGSIYDYGANKSSQGGVLDQPAMQGVWVKYSSGAPTSGDVVVTVIYAFQGGQA